MRNGSEVISVRHSQEIGQRRKEQIWCPIIFEDRRSSMTTRRRHKPKFKARDAEVHPAPWSRSPAHEGRTGDQHDSFSIAAWLARAVLGE